MSSQPSLKQWKATNIIWHGSRIRCNTWRDSQSRRSSSCREIDSYFTLCGEKKPPLKNSRMQKLSTYSKGKGILTSVTIIEASLYCQLLGRSLQESYWTDWMNTMNSQGFYQEGQRNNRHHLHSKTASRKMPGTECGPLHDLCRPYQSIWHSQSWGTWKIMTKFGCPAKFIAMVRQFHDGMFARVQKDGEFPDSFSGTDRVKQGCILASTLSSMFSAMLTDAFQDGDNCIPIRYRFDGKPLNLRKLQAKPKCRQRC